MRICTSPAAGGGGSGTSISSSLRSATSVSARIVPPGNSASIGSAVDAYRRRQPAVNRQVGAGNVGGLRGQQESDDAGNVLGLREALGGNLILHRLAILAVFRQHLGVDEAGRDVIDGNPAAGSFDRQCARIAEQGRLGRRVGRIALIAALCRDRSD